MAVFEIANHKSDDILHLLNYIYQPSKCCYAGTHNLYHGTTSTIASQFLYIKNYYGKTSGKQAEHFILSLDSLGEERDISSIAALSKIALHILPLFPEYQIAYAIHNDVPNLHVHFVMNTVNMVTGKHYRLNKSTFYPLLKDIASSLILSKIAIKGFSYFDEEGNFHLGQSESGFLYEYKGIYN